MRQPVLIIVLIALFMVSTAAAESLTFEVDDGGQVYSAIRLYMANLPRDFDLNASPIYTGQAKRFTVSNLTVGQTYKFAAVLVGQFEGKEIKSDLSNIVQQKIVAAVITAQPPVIAFTKFTPEGNPIFSVDDKGQTYDSIRLHGAKDGTNINWQVAGFYVGKDKLITVTGLPRGERWKFEAVLRTGQTATAPSNTVFVDLPAAQALPTPKATVDVIEGGAIITFVLPAGTIPTRYLVTMAEDPAMPDGSKVGTTYEGTISPIRITGLKNGTKYNFYPRYNVGGGISPRGATTSLTTPTVIILKAPGLLIIKTEMEPQ